jgi:hypothetical protein
VIVNARTTASLVVPAINKRGAPDMQISSADNRLMVRRIASSLAESH